MSRWIGSRGQLIVYAIDPATVVVRDVEGVTFRAATAGDAPRYARDVGTDSITTFVRRLDATNRCFIVDMDDRIVHSSWFTTSKSWVGEIAAYFILPPRHGYVYESFTHPRARGRGLYPLALARICRLVADEGCPRVWVAIEEDNLSSRRAVEKAGFEAIYAIAFERRLGSVRHRVAAEREELAPRISSHPA
ncbi:MAG: GNAT family N-acetyltransferase [Actinomycetota bacterium]|nr:GNAT family N-acetyltransferase [Actinomycetota bacterium]